VFVKLLYSVHIVHVANNSDD